MSVARLHAAMVAALSADPVVTEGVTAVFGAPPVRSALPYALVADAVAADWSTKDAEGVEARVAVELHDAREDGGLVRGLADAARAAVVGMPSGLGAGWRIVSLSFVRQRIVRTRGTWIASVEFRVRMLREEG